MALNTSLYISDHSIFAATGSDGGRALELQGLYRSALAPGIVSGGALRDPAALAGELDAFFARNMLPSRSCCLAVATGGLLLRVMEAPDLPPKKTRELLLRQLDQSGENGGMLCDYTPLCRLENGGVKVCCVGMERAQAEAWAEAFRLCGIKLTGIEPGLGSVIRFVTRLPEKLEGSFIISMLDGPTMVSLLFVDGVYSFTNRAALGEQRGSPAAAVEISRALSGILQFAMAQKLGGSVSGAYLCGMTGDEESFCRDMGDSLRMRVSRLPDIPGVRGAFLEANAIHYGDWLCCLGGLLDAKKTAMLDGQGR